MVVPAAVSAAVSADTTARRREYIFRLPSWAERSLQGMLNDPRDLPVALLLANILLTVLPGVCVVAAACSHLLAAAFLVGNYVLFLQRFLVALLHVTEHCRLFKKDLDALNLLVPYVLAPIFGLPSGMYKLHHKVMHHVEGNRAPLDASSTEQYQRDSLAHFLRYWAKHTFGAWFHVPLYAYRKGRRDLLLECLAGELLYLLALALISWKNPVAAIWLLLLPFLLTSVAIMFGNWSQHIFVDVREPQNVFRLTYNCIDCPDNQVTCNDGYHIMHHLNSKRHWSELPHSFLDSYEQHAAQQAFVFKGVGFFDVGLAVMTGRLDRLAACLVPCSQEVAAMAETEIIELMKSRLRPVGIQACIAAQQ